MKERDRHSKTARLLTAAAFAILAPGIATAGEISVNGCNIRWTDRTLEIKNGLFTRQYVATDGVLKTVSFKASGASAWSGVSGATNGCDRLSVDVTSAKWGPAGIDGARITVKAGGKTTRLDMYPSMPGVIVTRPGIMELKPVHDGSRQWKTLREDNLMLHSAMKGCDAVSAGNRHVKATSILLRDQSDIRDQLVSVDERLLMRYDWPYTLATSCLDLQDVITGEGVVFVRLAPMPVSRPVPTDDFIVSGTPGHTVALLANGYPLVELAYTGGKAGRRRALVAFQRVLRPYRHGRDGVLLSNTWGGGNSDSRINQEFLLKEITAGAKIGVDVIQIDDGWQHGRTQNSKKKANAGKKKVWNGYWAADPDFWKEDRDRFPDGLDFLVKKAAAHGMRFGLWFGPDSSDDAANWEKDADCLLDYHKRLGIDYFKMDSMKLFSPLALSRSRQMFDKMLTCSNGSMVFDLDSTAEIRPGFLGLVDIGPIFVENRGSYRGVYLPHHTLKNLWDLSCIIDPVRLRFEFNNPDTNHAKYEGRVLSHANYRADALFATVMAASPLAWMELSDVSEKSIAELAPLVRSWKAERERWHGGVIHPVGNRPDGVAWTGFVSEASDGDGGYALLFREFNEKDSCSLDLSTIFGDAELLVDARVGGRGDASVDGSTLTVNIPEKLDFIWLRLSKKR